ncbi:HSP20-like chaperone [Chytriomyces cf. hyalinus JEL632]|nr:HSP20-like chaperone [Chytriomyces cf. hyalinus JEL632]
MRNNSQRHTLTQVRQKHSEHHGKHSKAARSLQNALAVRNAKSVQGGRNSRQEEEDDEAFTTMEQAMSSAFDELGFKSAFHALQQLENEQDTDDVQEPDMDIHETDFSYVVQADLPGVKKGDLSVSIEDGILTVEGQRQNMFEHRRKGVHVVERNTGSFSRSVELPDNIIEDEVEASMENGVLTVEVFKNDPAWNGDADHLEDDDEEEEGDEEEEDGTIPLSFAAQHTR